MSTYAYSACQLFRRSCSSRMNATTWRTLVDLGLAARLPTRRGCRGGTRKQRAIAPVVGCRPLVHCTQSTTTSMNTTVSSLNDNSDTSTQQQIPKKGSSFIKILSMNCNSIKEILRTVSFVRYYTNTTHMSFWDVSQKLTIHSRLTASSLLTTRKCIGRTVPNTVAECFVQ